MAAARRRVRHCDGEDEVERSRVRKTRAGEPGEAATEARLRKRPQNVSERAEGKGKNGTISVLPFFLCPLPFYSPGWLASFADGTSCMYICRGSFVSQCPE